LSVLQLTVAGDLLVPTLSLLLLLLLLLDRRQLERRYSAISAEATGCSR
jgi:hypothetical protein